MKRVRDAGGKQNISPYQQKGGICPRGGEGSKAEKGRRRDEKGVSYIYLEILRG